MRRRAAPLLPHDYIVACCGGARAAVALAGDGDTDQWNSAHARRLSAPYNVARSAPRSGQPTKCAQVRCARARPRPPLHSVGLEPAALGSREAIVVASHRGCCCGTGHVPCRADHSPLNWVRGSTGKAGKRTGRRLRLWSDVPTPFRWEKRSGLSLVRTWCYGTSTYRARVARQLPRRTR